MMLHVEKIETLRVERGLRKYELAEAAGLSEASLTVVLKKGYTSLYNAEALAEALGVPPQWITRFPVARLWVVDVVRVEKFRNEREWTIARMTRECGCTYEAYRAMLDRGSLNPRYLARLARLLGTDLEELLIWDTEARRIASRIAGDILKHLAETPAGSRWISESSALQKSYPQIERIVLSNLIVDHKGERYE